MIVTESTTGAVFESVIVQVKLSVAVRSPSETVMVTLSVPAVPPMVPLMTPVEALIETPAGRPVAL